MSEYLRNPESPRSLSNADEDIELNPDLLVMSDMYNSTNIKLVGGHISFATIAAEETIKHLLDRTFRVLRDHYYEAKMTPHVISATHNLLEMCFTTEMIFSDNHEFVLNPDDEAV
jgi:hypothetical protein